MKQVRCCQCRKHYSVDTGAYNRAMAGTGKLFCSQACFGISRRKPKPPLVERKAKKAAYDVIYRAANAEDRVAAKREYHKLTYDPVKAAKKRKSRARWHVEYCRKYYADPKRKAQKVRYDQRRRDAKYGEFAPAVRLIRKLKREVCQKIPDKYERAKARGYYNNQRTTQERKRDAQISRW